MGIEWLSAAKLPTHRIRVCLYGDTRSGKTHAAATFPRPIFIFPRNEGSEEVIRGNDWPMVRINGRQDMYDALDTLLAAQRNGTLSQWGETVCVENLSHFSELVEMELTDRGARTMKEQWGAYSHVFMRMREVLWQLDAHVVFTALAHTKTDRQGSIIKAGVKVYGQSGDFIVSSCDIVGFCEQVPSSPPRWVTHVQQYGAYPGGTRIRGMRNGDYENFNFAEHVAPHL